MPRTLWLALISVTLVSVLFVLRVTTSGQVTRLPMPDQNNTVPDRAEDNAAPMAKGDRLPLLLYDSSRPARTEEKEVVPPPAEQPPIRSKRGGFDSPVPATKEVTTWHWHAGTKITRRSGQR
jgi:hypothetical protein